MNDQDPLDFARAVLERVPDDPAQTTLDDLATLAAAAEGMARHTLALRAACAGLARRVEAGEDLADLLAERGELAALEERVMAADSLLNDYMAAAMSAHGFDLAAMSAD